MKMVVPDQFLRVDGWPFKFEYIGMRVFWSRNRFPPMGARPLYAFPLDVSHGDIDRATSLLSGDTDSPDLINEGRPRPMSFYYENVSSTDGMIWCEILEFIAVWAVGSSDFSRT